MPGFLLCGFSVWPARTKCTCAALPVQKFCCPFHITHSALNAFQALLLKLHRSNVPAFTSFSVHSQRVNSCFTLWYIWLFPCLEDVESSLLIRLEKLALFKLIDDPSNSTSCFWLSIPDLKWHRLQTKAGTNARRSLVIFSSGKCRIHISLQEFLLVVLKSIWCC